MTRKDIEMIFNSIILVSLNKLKIEKVHQLSNHVYTLNLYSYG